MAGRARPGEAGPGRAWQAGLGVAGQGLARQGKARLGSAWRGQAEHGKAGVAWWGEARQGGARQGDTNPKEEAAMATRKETAVQISAPRMATAEFRIVGTAPYVQARFSAKAMNMMVEKMAAGQKAKKGKVREARDFDEDFRQALHVSTEGWHGIPASAFRQAIISACRLVGFKMTLAKLSVFVEADGFDAVDGIPLVRIEGQPESVTMAVRNATGVADLRVRPMWRDWSCTLRVTYDEDQFSLQDVTNLLVRVGTQVGIGEGRPDSRQSAGLGWGLFRLA